MAQDVVIGQERFKRRSPFGVWGLSLITAGIYGLVWWYKINNEARRYLADESIKPGVAVLAFLPGSVLIIPPYVSVFKTGKRVGRMEERAGLPGPASGGVSLLLAFVLGLYIIYLQSHLNRVWDAYLTRSSAGGPQTLPAGANTQALPAGGTPALAGAPPSGAYGSASPSSAESVPAANSSIPAASPSTPTAPEAQPFGSHVEDQASGDAGASAGGAAAAPAQAEPSFQPSAGYSSPSASTSPSSDSVSSPSPRSTPSASGSASSMPSSTPSSSTPSMASSSPSTSSSASVEPYEAPAPPLPPPQPAIPAGWYPDPSGQGGKRWWDGNAWTSHTAP